jgi:hypothetical protein
VAFAWGGLWLAACVPNVDTDDSIIEHPTVIAIQAEPAEAKPGQQVQYSALFVDESGDTASGRLTWFDCSAQKPVAELGPVSQDCFDEDSGMLSRIGQGTHVSGAMPFNACSLFGPNPPPPQADGPPGRPADPDITGGYKMPLVVGVHPTHGPTDNVIFQQRVYCGLAEVPLATSSDFAQHYRLNENPSLARVVVTRADGTRESVDDGGALELSPGEQITLDVRWPSCPTKSKCGDGICGIDEDLEACPADCTTPVGCGGREDYLWFDPQARELTTRRESMSVAWYANAGKFRDQRTGVTEEESANGSTNRWTAPEHASSALKLWIVLRDDRGGVGHGELSVELR